MDDTKKAEIEASYEASNLAMANRIFERWVSEAPMIRLYKNKLITALAEDLGVELQPYRDKIIQLTSEAEEHMRLG